MDHLTLSNTKPISKVVAPEADVSMGLVHGPFVPFLAYENVRPVFQHLTEASRKHFIPSEEEQLLLFSRKRDALSLSVTMVDGRPVNTLWINILDDWETLGDDGYVFSDDYSCRQMRIIKLTHYPINGGAEGTMPCCLSFLPVKFYFLRFRL